MARAFNKDILRSIKTSLGRFIAIAAIVALGAGFYSGLRMTCPDMNLSADRYYDGTDLMDIRVVSTMGMTDEDIAALREVDGVENVMGAYESDVMSLIDDEQYAMRVHSLSESALDSVIVNEATVQSDDDDYLNRLILAEGRWPTAAGECVISADRVMNVPTQLGDTLTITEGTTDLDDIFDTTTYTIVGFVHSSYYVSSSSMGTTTLGSGTIQQYMYVLDSNFAPDYPYTEAFIGVSGAKDLLSGSDAYQERIDEVMDNINAIADERENARAREIRADAQAELDDARAVYEVQRDDTYAELDAAHAALDDAAENISSGQGQITSGQQEYNEGLAELESQRSSVDQQLNDAEAQLEQSQAEVDDARSQLESAQQTLSDAWEQVGMTYDEASAVVLQLEDGIEQADEGITLVQQQIDALDPTDSLQAGVLQTLEEQKNELEEQRTALLQQQTSLQELISQQDTFNSTLGETQRQIDEGQAAIDEGRAELESQRADADRQLSDAERQLAEADDELAQGRLDVAEGQDQYEQGLSEYEQARIDAEAELADAEQQLVDAQKAIDEIEQPTWLIMDRTKNYGVASFSADAERVDNIAGIFPFIFFLVAALVALTTMTRMVEEERILIGTFKALGYSRARITSKYLIYAAAASILGAVVGIALLSFVLPLTIMQAYTIIYSVPPVGVLDVPLAALAAILGIGVTLIATWAAALSTLREQPAYLMLPRAPKAGKRILLERVGFLWRHLSFSWKVTWRNLFRYKRRLVMTIIGIAGCTALLLTGLGLQDSINDIINKHFGELLHYNVVVTTEDTMDEASKDELDGILSQTDMVSKYTTAQTTSMIAEGVESTDPVVTLVIPENAEDFQELWLLRNRTSQEELDLTKDGIIITEKLATTLNLQRGDILTLATQDDMGNATDETYDLVVGGIVENYLYNYVFATAADYEEVFGEAPVFSSIYATMSTDENARTQFNAEVRSISGIKTVAYNDETIDTYRTMLNSVNMVVVVLVVSAAALAFIVLYNLTNINITERKREIATLKVLGFLPREVDMYIYRETILLSIIGCLIGLVLGVFLEGFVVVTAEVDQVMFGRDIHVLSFIAAFVLTMVFTVIVMLFMRRKLANVDMIESLKSNE